MQVRVRRCGGRVLFLSDADLPTPGFRSEPYALVCVRGSHIRPPGEAVRSCEAAERSLADNRVRRREDCCDGNQRSKAAEARPEALQCGVAGGGLTRAGANLCAGCPEARRARGSCVDTSAAEAAPLAWGDPRPWTGESAWALACRSGPRWVCRFGPVRSHPSQKARRGEDSCGTW